MKKRSERGFGVVEVILVIIIVALIGALGWLFWERSNSASTETSDTSKTEEQKPSKNDTKEEVKTTTVSNQYFSVVLPEDWKEVEWKSEVGAPKASYQYANETGTEISILVGYGGFGSGGADGSASFTITGNKFVLDKTYKPCTTVEGQNNGCTQGDGKLTLDAINYDAAYNGNNYLFRFADSKSESQEAYKAMAAIVESIELK